MANVLSWARRGTMRLLFGGLGDLMVMAVLTNGEAGVNCGRKQPENKDVAYISPTIEDLSTNVSGQHVISVSAVCSMPVTRYANPTTFTLRLPVPFS